MTRINMLNGLYKVAQVASIEGAMHKVGEGSKIFFGVVHNELKGSVIHQVHELVSNNIITKEAAQLALNTGRMEDTQDINSNQGSF